jgi:aldose 1-epimerase
MTISVCLYFTIERNRILTMAITKSYWGNVDGREIELFKLSGDGGSYVELSNYGATVVSINVPDRNGKLQNVILGFDSLEGYLRDTCYIGATIGRFANRIANASFVLDGVDYQLERNDGVNTNHSASSGFNYKVFDHHVDNDELIFRLLSPDEDGGYPGNLSFEIGYRWTGANELKMRFKATTDKPTVVNFTNHCYFNLSGSTKKIFDHRLTIDADKVVEANDDYIPTGSIIDSGELSFDNMRVADRMTAAESDIKGLNICYVLNASQDNIERRAAVLTEDLSGRRLTVYTTYPGLMLYTGAYLNSRTPGSHKILYQPFDGMCLECQYFPDSPNQPGFPATILRPGEILEETITYLFDTLK